MKNSFFSRFTPKEPKFFPLLKQLSEILLSSSALLIEILGHDSPEKRAEDYKRIKDLEREGDKLTNLILDELGTTFITPFDREDIHDLASGMDDVIDGIKKVTKEQVIEAANDMGKQVCVCGEMAGDAAMTRLLLGLGLRSFSMHPAQILSVKQEVLRADTRKLQPWAQTVLAAESPAALLDVAQ